MVGSSTSHALSTSLSLLNTAAEPAPDLIAPARVPARAGLHLELAERLEGLPRDLGVALIGLGMIGVVIPGPIPPGASFILMGTAFLWPGFLARWGGWLARRLPRMMRVLIDFVDHLRSDLKNRYPGSVPA